MCHSHCPRCWFQDHQGWGSCPGYLPSTICWQAGSPLLTMTEYILHCCKDLLFYTLMLFLEAWLLFFYCHFSWYHSGIFCSPWLSLCWYEAMVLSPTCTDLGLLSNVPVWPKDKDLKNMKQRKTCPKKEFLYFKNLKLHSLWAPYLLLLYYRTVSKALLLFCITTQLKLDLFSIVLNYTEWKKHVILLSTTYVMTHCISKRKWTVLNRH